MTSSAENKKSRLFIDLEDFRYFKANTSISSSQNCSQAMADTLSSGSTSNSSDSGWLIGIFIHRSNCMSIFTKVWPRVAENTVMESQFTEDSFVINQQRRKLHVISESESDEEATLKTNGKILVMFKLGSLPEVEFREFVVCSRCDEEANDQRIRKWRWLHNTFQAALHERIRWRRAIWTVVDASILFSVHLPNFHHSII